MTFSNAFCASPGFPVEGDENDEELFPGYKERVEAMQEFVNQVALADPGDVIPLPYSSEFHTVKTQEEFAYELLTHPRHCEDTIMGTIMQKQLNGEEEISEDLMPPVVLDTSGRLGINQLSEKQLHKMFFCQMSVDYSKFSLEDLGRLQIGAYSEMFIFLNKAEQCAKRTYEYNLRTAIAIAFSDGVKDILSKPSPRLQIMKNLAKGIMYLAAQSYTDLEDMYHNLEMAILWAEKADNYGTAAAKRMGHK